jgi:antitoxin ParD1/3/4
MTVTVTITLTDEQEAYARWLVEEGIGDDLQSAVKGSLYHRRATHQSDTENLKTLLEERRKGPFISPEEVERETEAMLAQEMAPRDVSR